MRTSAQAEQRREAARKARLSDGEISDDSTASVRRRFAHASTAAGSAGAASSSNAAAAALASLSAVAGESGSLI